MRNRLVLLTLLLAMPGGAAEPEYPSPGGEYILRLFPEEVRMSHWVEQPQLVRARDGVEIWSEKMPWSVDRHEWVSSEELSLELRRYPGDRPPVKLMLTIAPRTFRLWDAQRKDWSHRERPLRELKGALEDAATGR